MHSDDSAPPPSLARAVALLREEPAVRSEWLTAVLDGVAEQRVEPAPNIVPTSVPARWSIRPSVAIAAGLVFAALGAGATYAVSGRAAGALGTSGSLVAATAAGAAQVRFALVAPGAVNVTLVGDFNGWNPASLPMRRSPSGDTWVVEVGLAPGRYTYSFVVDGRLARDPSAAESARDDFGVPSSVVLVKGT